MFETMIAAALAARPIVDAVPTWIDGEPDSIGAWLLPTVPAETWRLIREDRLANCELRALSGAWFERVEEETGIALVDFARAFGWYVALRQAGIVVEGYSGGFIAPRGIVAPWARWLSDQKMGNADSILVPALAAVEPWATVNREFVAWNV
jgi:hypothetical protein